MTNEQPNTRAGEALKPCPCCKAAPRRSLAQPKNGPDSYAIGCSKCILVTEWAATEAEAITAWNTRPLPQPSELVDDDARLILRLAGVRNKLTPGAIERADLDGMAFTIGESQDRIAEMSAQIAKLQADKWDVRHTSTMNDLAQMGMARDAAIEDAAKLQADGDKLAGALEAFQRHYDLNDCDERCGALEVPISDLRRACQALTEWKDRT